MRFLSDDGEVGRYVKEALKAIEITDPNFVEGCLGISSKLLQKSMNDIWNKRMTIYRRKLKTCKWYSL